MKIEIEIPDEFKGLLEYIEDYLTKILKRELSSRNLDLNFFLIFFNLLKIIASLKYPILHNIIDDNGFD